MGGVDRSTLSQLVGNHRNRLSRPGLITVRTGALPLVQQVAEGRELPTPRHTSLLIYCYLRNFWSKLKRFNYPESSNCKS